jgi:hypothetical protein
LCHYESVLSMNRLLSLCATTFVLIIVSSGLTNLDYTLGGSKNGKGSAEISEDGFQGSHSTRLSVVPEKSRYARIYTHFNNPVPIGELDRLSMWMKPVAGSGKLTLDIYFYGGGKISSTRSWSNGELGRWQELDAFDLNFGNGNLSESLRAFSGKSIEKIWIKLYNTGNVQATAYIDYMKIRDQVISFEPFEKEKILAAPKSVGPGEKITYIITYGNNQLVPIDLVIENQFDTGVVPIEADPLPDPGSNSIWTIRNLPPGMYGQIKIVTRTHKLSSEAKITGNVWGNGLMSASRSLSTDQPGYQVTNTVTISSSKFSLSASATTNVRPVDGATIDFSEHGSGSYSSNEAISYSPSKIVLRQNLQANGTYRAINLSSRALSYNGVWHAGHAIKNRITETSISERFIDSDTIDLDRSSGIRRKDAWMETKSNFTGIEQYSSRAKNMASDQMLVGSFRTRNKEVEWYNSSGKYSDKSWLDCCSENSGIQAAEEIEVAAGAEDNSSHSASGETESLLEDQLDYENETDTVV